MYTKHVFNPPETDDVVFDDKAFTQNGKVLNCYAVECKNEKEANVVMAYYMFKRNFSTHEFFEPLYVGFWLYEGKKRAILSTASLLNGNKRFLSTHTPMISFDDFERLSDQEEFDVLKFIEDLG